MASVIWLLASVCIILGNVSCVPLTMNDNVGFLGSFNGISFSQCRHECDTRNNCGGTSYFRLFSLCQLFGSNHIQNETARIGEYIYSKPSSVRAENTLSCDQCASNEDCFINTTSATVSCSVTRCGKPVFEAEVHTQGNILNVGSKLKAVCSYLPHEEHFVTCEQNGQWSDTTFECFCEPQSIPNVAKASSAYLNASHIGIEYECVEGFQRRYVVRPTCNVETREVQNIKRANVCCDRIVNGDWTKVFRTNFNNGLDIWNLWTSSGQYVDNAGWSCKYRYSAIVDNWGASRIQKVKVDIVKDEVIVAFLIFNGVGSTIQNWFQGSRLLESSWEDLTPETAPCVDEFSIKGARNDFSVYDRFLIAYDSDNKCADNVGWLMVTEAERQYECSQALTGEHTWLVYALHNRSGIFSGTGQNVGQADRMDIWVQF